MRKEEQRPDKIIDFSERLKTKEEGAALDQYLYDAVTDAFIDITQEINFILHFLQSMEQYEGKYNFVRGIEKHVDPVKVYALQRLTEIQGRTLSALAKTLAQDADRGKLPPMTQETIAAVSDIERYALKDYMQRSETILFKQLEQRRANMMELDSV